MSKLDVLVDALILLLVGAALMLFSQLCAGCSAGPQIVTAVPVVSCNWQVADGGTCNNCRCNVYGSAITKPLTTGNETHAQTQNDIESSVQTGGTSSH